MTTITSDAPEHLASETGVSQAVRALAILSMAAGFLHASVVDAHRGHGIAATVFLVTAIFQVAWAGVAMARPSRTVLAVGAIGNLVIVAGYVMTRVSGISFLDGFEETEPVGFVDGVTTALEVLIVLGALALLVNPDRKLWPAGQIGMAGLAVVGLAVAGVSVPAAASGATHAHGEEGGGHPHGTEEAAAHEHGDDATSDLDDHGHSGGEAAAHEHEGQGTATPEQIAAANDLLARTEAGLWQWADPQRRYDAGFRSIGDGLTGTEHLVNWNWINDDVVLDPNKPESLVFRTTAQGPVLEAAMYMAPAGIPDDQIPDVGGPITQWHVHDNLCYAPETMVDGFPERRVTGLISSDGTCRRGEALDPLAPMLHVWVVDHPCGRFAALEGVGAGQAVTEATDPNADPACQHSAH